MDSTFLTTQISAALTSTGGVTCTAAGLQTALLLSVLAYSSYRPVLRQMGEAQTVSNAAISATSLVVVGGLFTVGQSVYVDYCGPNEYTTTISAITPYADQGGDASIGIAAKLSTITVPALPAAITEGAIVYPVPVSNNSGLQLTVNRERYRLPGDFVRPDQDSLDTALGMKSSVNRGQGFYDAAYSIGSLYSQVGYGQRTDFGAGYASGYPIVGNPYNNPNGAPGQVPPGTTVLRFLLQSNPTLVISPPPGQSWWLNFYYFGCHVPASIPAHDADAVISYALYSVFNALASDFAGQGGVTVFGITERGDKSAAEYRTIAANYLAQFESRIRFSVVATSG